MIVNDSLCVGCGACAPYCPMGCMRLSGGKMTIDQDECVECEICRTIDVCPVNALEMPELGWPRSLRNQFSNPTVPHPKTNVPGRGTEEMKTNDVTGRFRRGRVGMAAELGRPGTGTFFTDVEKVAMAVAPHILGFEELNPVTALMADKKTGKLRDDVLGVKSLSAIVEFEVLPEKLPAVLSALDAVKGQIDTVFSLDLACRLEKDGSNPAADFVRGLGYWISPNGKTCVGLGRPLFKEEE